jgi:class 3 adenylate cyclase
MLAVLVPLWALCFVLELRAVLSPVGFPPVFVDPWSHGDEYPRVHGFLAQGTGPAVLELRAGDRLVRMGGRDLRGVSSPAFVARFADASRADGRVAIEFERGGVPGRTVVEAPSIIVLLPLLPAAAIFALASVLMLVRAGPSPMVRAWFLVFMCLAFFLSATFLGGERQTYAAMAVHFVTMTLIGPLTLRALLRFPHGVPPRGWGPRLGPWALAVVGVLHMSRFGFPPPPEVAVTGALIGVAAFLIASLVIITRTYRRVDSIGRRQMRWFLFGVYCGIAPPLFTAALAAIDPLWTPVYFASLSALACIPVAMLVSVARYNLFDVDRLITAAASYNATVIVILAVGLLIIPNASAYATSVVGLQPEIGRVIFSLLLALVIVPLHRGLRPYVERLFFAERHALEQGVEQLLHAIPNCSDALELTRLLGETLSRLVRPESCVVYARSNGDWLPLFAQGGPVLPALQSDGPIIATVRAHPCALAVAALAHGHALRTTPLQRAVLETLDAAVVVPVGRAGEPELVICLGAKRSGDLYTAGDLRLLELVAQQASVELQRFGQLEVVRQAADAQQALRRYVPRALADRLERGEHPAAGEYHVTLLFVDLRGFTTYSEITPLAHVVSVVNRYTEIMSQLVGEYGGTLLEFFGDGLMAVFGAPQPLADKERAAVEAARRMTEAVRTIPSGDVPLSVGVGIATGRAFVGDIRSHDRLIWSAIGDIANLAARLQSFTRECDAAIAIDAATHAAAGSAAADFECLSGIRIRGRRQTEDVYVLPQARVYADELLPAVNG